MALYDSIDMDFSWDGDYAISDDGDLKDTTYDYLQSLRNEIHNVMRSEFGDWELNPNFGANASDFRGEPNTRETGTAIEERFRARIVAAGIVRAGDLGVRVVPVGIHQVMVVINISATATPANGLTAGELLTITLLYDTLEDSVFYLEKSKQEKDYRSV